MTLPVQQYVFKAQLLRVIDGDTLDLDIDLGLHCHRQERVRLLRVNAPEMHGTSKAAGEAAKMFTTQWLYGGDAYAVPSLPLIVQTYKSDVFGRYLAEVWRISDGANLNDDLLTSGNAVPFQ